MAIVVVASASAVPQEAHEEVAVFVGVARCSRLEVSGEVAVCYSANSTPVHLLSLTALGNDENLETIEKVLNGMLHGSWIEGAGDSEVWSEARIEQLLSVGDARQELVSVLWKLRENPLLRHPDRATLGLLLLRPFQPEGDELLASFYLERSRSCPTELDEWQPSVLGELAWTGWQSGEQVLEKIGDCVGPDLPPEPPVLAAIGLGQLGREVVARTVLERVLGSQLAEVPVESAEELRHLLGALPADPKIVREALQDMDMFAHVGL